MVETESIDRLYLELSQFTGAVTKRERELLALNAELLEIVKLIPGYGYCLPKVVTDQAKDVIAKCPPN